VVSLLGWSVADQDGGSVVGPTAVESAAEAVEVALGLAAQRRARP